MAYRPKDLYFFIGTDADGGDIQVSFTVKVYFEYENAMSDNLGSHNMPTESLMRCGVNPYEEQESVFSILNGFTPRQVYDNLFKEGFGVDVDFNNFMSDESLPEERLDEKIQNGMNAEEIHPFRWYWNSVPPTGWNNATRNLFGALRDSGAQIHQIRPGESATMRIGENGQSDFQPSFDSSNNNHNQQPILKLGLEGQTHYVMGDKVIIPLSKLEKLQDKIVVSKKYGNGKTIGLTTYKKGTPDEYDVLEVEFNAMGRIISLKYNLDGIGLEEPIKGLYDLTIPDDLMDDIKDKGIIL